MYTSLIKQIPINIVQSLDALLLTAPRRNTIMTDISSAKQACTLCYSLQLNSNIKSAIPSQAKWSRIFGHELSWTNIYTLLYQVSLDSSLRSFQYNYLMSLTPTNIYLFKRNMIHADLCYFCFQHNEECEHLFWRCCHVQRIWNNLIKY